jgi:hypothetical protein
MHSEFHFENICVNNKPERTVQKIAKWSKGDAAVSSNLICRYDNDDDDFGLMVKMAPWITGLSRVRLRSADIVSRGLRIGRRTQRKRGRFKFE